jgi:DNA-binding cell septation regulator SpoVG
MKIIRMNHLDGTRGNTLAFFDIQTPEGIIIKGFRVVRGSKGLFISAQNEKGKDGKYYDTVILPREIKDPLEKQAVEEYNKVK